MGQSQGTLKNPQSYPSLTKAKPGEGVPRILAQGKMPPTKAKYEGCDSIPKMFARAAGLYPENNLFGTRVKLDDGSFGPFEWISYKQGYESMLKVCSAVAGIGFGKGATFGLYASNSSAWQIAGMGCFFRGMTAVPIYDTLGDNIVQYEVNHAEIPLIFVDANKLGNVASVIKDCPSLKYIVQLQPLATHPAKSAAAFQEAGVTLTDLDSVMAAGAAAPVAPTPADGDDLAFIMCARGPTPASGALSACTWWPPACARPPTLTPHSTRALQVHVWHDWRPEGRVYPPALHHNRLELAGRHRAVSDGPLPLVLAACAHFRDDG